MQSKHDSSKEKLVTGFHVSFDCAKIKKNIEFLQKGVEKDTTPFCLRKKLRKGAFIKFHNIFFG